MSVGSGCSLALINLVKDSLMNIKINFRICCWVKQLLLRLFLFWNEERERLKEIQLNWINSISLQIKGKSTSLDESERELTKFAKIILWFFKLDFCHWGNFNLSCVYIGEVCLDNDNDIVSPSLLALSTLGGVAQDVTPDLTQGLLTLINGSCTLAKFVSETVCDNNMWQSHDSQYCTCLGHLVRHGINRNDPICVAPPKVAKASKEGDAISWALSS